MNRFGALIAGLTVAILFFARESEAGCCTVPCLWYEMRLPSGECVPCDGGSLPDSTGTICVPVEVVPCEDAVTADADSVSDTSAFYGSDPDDYWVGSGLPNLGRLSRQRSNGGDSSYLGAYDGVMDHFDSGMWSSSVSMSLLGPAEPFYMSQASSNPSDSPSTLVRKTLFSISQYVDSLGLSAESSSALASSLYEPIFFSAFNAVSLHSSLGPAAVEICNTNATTIPTTTITPCEDGKECSIDGGTTCPATDPLAVPAGKPDDNDETKTFDWLKIKGSPCNTTYNPMCRGQSLGPCLFKLREPGYGRNFTCKQWNELGKRSGSSNPGGKYFTDFMQDLGYAYHVAKDANEKTACENADAALKRGCDVLIHWPGTDTVSGHIEYVSSITVNGDNKKNCQAKTNSWGQEATVDYKDGGLHDKSDKDRYGAGAGISVSQQGYKGRFEIFCPKVKK